MRGLLTAALLLALLWWLASTLIDPANCIYYGGCP